MIWFLIVFIVCVFIFCILLKMEGLGLFWSILLAAFVGSMWSFTLTSKHVNTEEYIVSEINLQAFTDSTSMSGRKYLMSGYIDEQLKLRYIISTQYGKQIEEMDINNYTYIQDTNQEEAKKITYGVRVNDKSHWYDWIIYTKTLVEDSCTKIEFIVPEGTVSNEYNVDLK